LESWLSRISCTESQLHYQLTMSLVGAFIMYVKCGYHHVGIYVGILV
jgi:hypothetical protein